MEMIMLFYDFHRIYRRCGLDYMYQVIRVIYWERVNVFLGIREIREICVQNILLCGAPIYQYNASRHQWQAIAINVAGIDMPSLG
ncbi:MAG: hypothetical protein IJZ55_03415, partial [Lachnospiraceae bacterium]|nr:hypothetical protein [Lachnospiraceae bacterium]